MPSNKMLIDASHPEETRVVVVRGNRIEEFDFESQDKKQLRGNIYLARVTRVEPSLQAAFVEYGGNRHGFLAFSEIHPDYYQIPVADRQALLRAEAEDAEADDDDNGNEDEGRQRRSRGKGRSRAKKNSNGSGQADTDAEASGSAANAGDEDASAIAAKANADVLVEDTAPGADDDQGNDDSGEIDTVGAEDAIDEAQTRRKPVRRQYKIQEVIKRRQILLVQVVKEERGNKGAALTTYLSLAGRYSVLMPNTARGGGISRKITNPQDRKRLKEIVHELEVPEGIGVILRTAGANRTKAEIKRDYEYLMRLWEKVRTLTLESTAPCLVYEEGSLIKRSVRDLYNKDIGEVMVAGEEGYREAKDFMRMLMPSHAKAVQPYRDTIPIFARNGIEGQLDKMLQPQVTLKSGGYIIINQTEALVAIDVNSGRSTKEHSIENTALQTNLEAAEEVSRQLRLRDLAGLIVIDFIDMEENRNNRAVEKKLKECLKNDRARIQVGRISHFGLLEMSRQRIRASVLESTMQPCPHCGGTGHVRSESSVALLVVRAIEEYLLKDQRNDITVRTPSSTALYVLNNKRANLAMLEERFGVAITIEADETVGSQHYVIVKGLPSEREGTFEHITIETPVEEDEDEEVEEAASEQEEARTEAGDGGDGSGDGGRRKRRRRRRRGGRDRDRQPDEGAHLEASVSDLDGMPAQEGASDDRAEADEGDDRKKRRRGKRGGRRNRRDADTDTQAAEADELAPAQQADAPAQQADAPAEEAGPIVADEVPAPREEPEAAEAEEKPKKKAPRRRTKKAEAAEAEIEGESAAAARAGDGTPAGDGDAEGKQEEKPAASKPRRSRKKADNDSTPVEPVVSSSDTDEEQQPRKTGWWQRKGFF